MKSLLLGFLIFNFSLLISNCGLDVEDPTPPSPPVWVQKSLPEEWPERGIDAHELGGIFLEWEPAPEESIIEYEIFRAEYYEQNDSLGDFFLHRRLDVRSMTKTIYLDQYAEIEMKYYFKLKAVDESNNCSEFSDSLSYARLPAVKLDSMTPNGISVQLNEERVLSWRYEYSIEMEEYCLNILTDANELVVRVVVQPGNYIGSTETWRIPDDIVLNDGQNYKWRVDTGARYINGMETRGSESLWAIFYYTETAGR